MVFSKPAASLSSSSSSSILSTPKIDISTLEASVKPSSIQPWSFSQPHGTSPPAPVHHLDPDGHSGQLTPLISQLTSLTILNPVDNNFYGLILSSISSLIHLQTLTLHSDSFFGVVSNSIASLKSLESLDFSHNYLYGYLPKN